MKYTKFNLKDIPNTFMNSPNFIHIYIDKFTRNIEFRLDSQSDIDIMYNNIVVIIETEMEIALPLKQKLRKSSKNFRKNQLESPWQDKKNADRLLGSCNN